jgi:hypothetical protein
VIEDSKKIIEFFKISVLIQFVYVPSIFLVAWVVLSLGVEPSKLITMPLLFSAELVLYITYVFLVRRTFSHLDSVSQAGWYLITFVFHCFCIWFHMMAGMTAFISIYGGK